MKLAGIDRRGRVMLIIAWSASFVCSVPQSIIFHVENHPKVADYTQCVTYNFFATENQEIAYAMTCMVLLYALPLIIIIFCYASIYRVLLQNSRKCLSGLGMLVLFPPKRKRNDFLILDRFRRSNDDVLSRAKKKTLWMTITIVIVFVVCWTPFYVISVW